MPEPPLANPGEFLKSKEIPAEMQEVPVEYDLTETQLTEREMDAIRQLVRDSRNSRAVVAPKVKP